MVSGKEARIITLLVIDIIFFFVEIITGYAVGSLALVADSFHMLNDVMSLIVALWAVKLTQKSSDHRFSYGWQRAEILGALVNGVFLLALCFSIFMEAIERFANVTEVKNPKLVVIVGSLGLASNLVGLLLFHDHGHSHGGHSHGGHSHGAHSHSPTESSENATIVNEIPSVDSVTSLFGHPAHTRALVVQAAQDMGYDSANPITTSTSERARLNVQTNSGYGSTSVDANHAHHHNSQDSHSDHSHDDIEAGDDSSSAAKKRTSFFQRKKADDHADHDGHAHSSSSHGHDHSHEGSMNMRGVFLHVLGDALGNVGVIASGLFIMLTSYSWRYYSDPLISFLITIIIFHSALPLVKSASFILLQAVPTSVSLESVRQSIQSVQGVLNIHELHIWQLSESKIVASVHVLVDCSSKQNEKYMEIAGLIRSKLHQFGIHSSTIQPEFIPGGLREAARMSGIEIDANLTDSQGRLITIDGDLVESEFSKRDTVCLIACGTDDSCKTSSCCPPLSSKPPSTNGGSGRTSPH